MLDPAAEGVGHLVHVRDGVEVVAAELHVRRGRVEALARRPHVGDVVDAEVPGVPVGERAVVRTADQVVVTVLEGKLVRLEEVALLGTRVVEVGGERAVRLAVGVGDPHHAPPPDGVDQADDRAQRDVGDHAALLAVALDVADGAAARVAGELLQLLDDAQEVLVLEARHREAVGDQAQLRLREDLVCDPAHAAALALLA